jgi:hypothetical protein
MAWPPVWAGMILLGTLKGWAEGLVRAVELMKFGLILRTYSGDLSLNPDLGAAVIAGQLVLLMMVTLCSSASAQNDQAGDYTRSSQPPLLSYQELVTLGKEETVDPALAAKVQTLLTTRGRKVDEAFKRHLTPA